MTRPAGDFTAAPAIGTTSLPVAHPSLSGLFANSPRRWLAVLCLFCGLAIALLSWESRYSINPDGISYLDMADQILKGNLGALVHPYWSPLYPVLLALALRVFSPTPSGEILVVHLLNCVIGLSALASFTFFVTQWSRVRANGPKDNESITDFRLRTGFAYSLFLWGTVEMVGLAVVTPDLCVAALVYLTAGLCCRLASPRGGWATSVALGFALSVAYFTKAAMLPLGTILLVVLAVPRLYVLPRRWPLGIAALIFAITIGSYVFALSRHQHRLTFGEAARLNYEWVVLREAPTHAGWIEPTPATGIPMHPPRVLRVQPTVLEFKGTVPGTYPLWYDPAFFHEGLQVRFDMRKQVLGLMRSSKDFLVLNANRLSPLFAGIIVLYTFAIRRRFRADSSRAWLILWPVAAFSMFTLVTLDVRYVSAFLVLFWIAAYDTVSPGMSGSAPSAYRAVIAVTAIGVMLPQLFHIGSAAARAIQKPKAPTQLVVASELARLGLRPDDEIATVGYPFSVYYARLARLRVIANIGFRGENEAYDTDRFWALSDSEINSLKEDLRRIGTKAIVSPEKCDVATNHGWHSIRDTEYCVQILN